MFGANNDSWLLHSWGGRVPFESLESFLFFPSCHRGWLGQFGRCSWMTKKQWPKSPCFTEFIQVSNDHVSMGIINNSKDSRSHRLVTLFDIPFPKQLIVGGRGHIISVFPCWVTNPTETNSHPHESICEIQGHTSTSSIYNIWICCNIPRLTG